MRTTAKASLAFLTIFLFVGVAQAQSNALPAPGMLPDHPLYFLKAWSEGFGTLFTFGELANADGSLDLAEKRLAEASALAARGKPEIAERSIARYEERLDRALAGADEANAKGADTDQLSARTSVATLRHQAVLADVYQRVPEAARPGIERAMRAGMQRHERAMNLISGEKREEVMQGVERRRQELGPGLIKLRARGVPIPAVRSRAEVERSMPARPERGRPPAPGRPQTRGNDGEGRTAADSL